MEFTANSLMLDEGPPVVLSVADNPESPREYAILSYDPTEKGQGLYVELNDQIRSGYNLISNIECLASSLVIHLSAEGEKVLRSDRRIVVSLSTSAAQWSSVRTKIRELFGGLVPISGE